MSAARSLASRLREERGTSEGNPPWSNGFPSIDESRWCWKNSEHSRRRGSSPIASDPGFSNLSGGEILRGFETTEPVSSRTGEDCNPRFRRSLFASLQQSRGKSQTCLKNHCQTNSSASKADGDEIIDPPAFVDCPEKDPGGGDSDGATAPGDQIGYAY